MEEEKKIIKGEPEQETQKEGEEKKTETVIQAKQSISARYSKIKQCPIWKDVDKSKKIGFLVKNEKCDVESILCEGEWLEIISEKEKYHGFVQSHLVGKTELAESIKTQLESLTDAKTTNKSQSKSKQKAKKDQDEDKNEDNNEEKNETKTNPSNPQTKDAPMSYTFEAIGTFHSIFPDKNGTPRNAGISNAKGYVQLTLPNAGHFIDGLENFSHLMIFWIFHQNTATRSKIHPKIRPPRLEGIKVGVLATRTPHRPNPIGFSVVKIDSIDPETGKIFCVGADIVDGTPILDIKPYIPEYDAYLLETTDPEEIKAKSTCKIPNWMSEKKNKRIDESKISFDPKALQQLSETFKKVYGNDPSCGFFKSEEEIKKTIIDVLAFDPRPEYVRRKNNDKLYGVRLDKINVRCSFDKDDNCLIKEIEEWQE